jgi:hypothetical protein
MVISETIRIKVSSGLKQNYSNLGYDFSKDEVDFKISDLKESSNQKIDVICDICKNEYNLQYCKYIKNIKRNGFYSCKECGLKRRSDMMKDNNLSLNKDYQDKKKKTFIKNYGVDNPSKSDMIKEKKRKTCLENYGVDCGLKLSDKIKSVMVEKYGVIHALESEVIKDKMRSSLIDRYGVDNVSKLQDVKLKKEETCMKNYGVKNPSQNKNISKKQILSYKREYKNKYGVEHPLQRSDIFNNILKSSYKITYFNDVLFSQGSYELDFLRYCESNGIIDMLSNGPSLEYKLNDKSHIYHSDFYIEKYNLIIEIKSTYTYNYDLDKNLAKEIYSKLNGYDFLFIIDKDYDYFFEIVTNSKL